MAEFETITYRATRKGPELDDIADRLCDELPAVCANCPAAFAVRCAISEDSFGLPRTPRAARMSFRDGTTISTISTQAEFALRSIVKRANELPGTGPKGENDSVCCLDQRNVQRVDYSTDAPFDSRFYF